MYPHEFHHKGYDCEIDVIEHSDVIKYSYRCTGPDGETISVPLDPYDGREATVKAWIDLGAPGEAEMSKMGLGWVTKRDLKGLRSVAARMSGGDSAMPEEILRLSGVLNEAKTELTLEEFAKKRHDGAEKISDGAKSKGGVALLTHHHFVVKLPYYKQAASGKFSRKKANEEYKKLCSELHSYMDDIAGMDQTKFQKLVGKIEVLGELLIRNKDVQE